MIINNAAFDFKLIVRFQWKSHTEAMSQLQKLYWPVLKANWQFWTLLQFINLTFVPPMVCNYKCCHIFI